MSASLGSVASVAEASAIPMSRKKMSQTLLSGQKPLIDGSVLPVSPRLQPSVTCDKLPAVQDFSNDSVRPRGSASAGVRFACEIPRRPSKKPPARSLRLKTSTRLARCEKGLLRARTMPCGPWRPCVHLRDTARALRVSSVVRRAPRAGAGCPAAADHRRRRLQTSFVHTDPDDEDGFDRRLPARQRPPLRERLRDQQDQVHVQHRIQRRHQRRRRPGRGGAVRVLRQFNIWVGRFLPPSDRANLYGPYYAHHWAVYTDGVQDGYPFIFQGRDNGAMYWGQFGKVKVSAGAFDGALGDRRRHAASAPARVQVDFWDAGDRLLPERHLLRRQEHPGHRRRRPGPGRATRRPTASTSCSSGRSATAARSRSRPSGRSTTGWAATTRDYGTDDGGYVLGALSVSDDGRAGPVRGPRQVRAGAVPRGPDHRSTSTTTRRPPSST